MEKDRWFLVGITILGICLIYFWLNPTAQLGLSGIELIRKGLMTWHYFLFIVFSSIGSAILIFYLYSKIKMMFFSQVKSKEV